MPQYGAPKNHLSMLPDGHRHRLRRRYQTVWSTVGQTNPQTPLFRQIRNLLLDLRAEAIGVHRIDVLNRTNNEISWLLRELYFETF